MIFIEAIFTRRIDDSGKIAVPEEILGVLGIKRGTLLELIISDKSIILRPYRTLVSEKLQAIANDLERNSNATSIESKDQIYRSVRLIRELSVKLSGVGE